MSELDDLITVRVLVSRPGEEHLTLTRVNRRLESWQALVGGDIEHLALSPFVGAYINENGKAEGLALNERGDFLVNLLLAAGGRFLMPGDYIVGPVVFTGPADDQGWDTDVPKDLLATLRKQDWEIREEEQ